MSDEALEWWCVKAASWMQRVVNNAEQGRGLCLRYDGIDLDEKAEGQRLLYELDELVEKLTVDEPETAA